MSTAVLTTFAKDWAAANSKTLQGIVGQKDENGINILEALSATGLRSIRYAKEVIGIDEIVANDISKPAVEAIEVNVLQNGVQNLIQSSHADAINLMSSSERRYTAIDLDPYGCPSKFLDSAVRAVQDGGLLLVTSTDMAVLCGNTPETCHVKYGAVSLKMKACHEQAIRILLRCIESHANRYGRYITPLLSISVDFYIRVFVLINSGQHECKRSSSKQSLVYQCCGCESLAFQPLGVLKPNPTEKKPDQMKFGLQTGPPVGPKCEFCKHSHHIGGPIWTAPIHDLSFIDRLMETVKSETYNYLATRTRIFGILSVIKEELPDIPLYYTLTRLCATLKLESIPALKLRSALLHAGYRVSYSHACKTSVKTDAPPSVIWDILRCWAKIKPVKQERFLEGTPLKAILSKEPSQEYNLTDEHPLANPPSRKEALVRYPENPAAYWGPGCRATLMLNGVSEDRRLKSLRNQNKSYRRAQRDASSPEGKDTKVKQVKLDKIDTTVEKKVKK